MIKQNKMGTIGIVSLILGLLGIVASVGTSVYNNANTTAARKENYNLNEKAAENADIRTRNLYTDFSSPQAQYDQLKAAGLSPSLFYSKNGTGGVTTTGAMGQGVAGLSNPILSMGNPMDMAQTALMNAQADKAEAEADRIRGKGQTGEADLQLLYSQIGLNKSTSKLTDIQSDLAEIDKLIKSETSDAVIKEIEANARYAANNADYMFYHAEAENWNVKEMKATFDTKIKIVKQDLANKQMEYLVKVSEKKLNDEQRAKIAAETEEIYNSLFYYTETEIATKDAYTAWLKKQTETLKEQLELRAKELKLENTKMWLDFSTDMVDTAGKTLGMLFLGKGKGSFNGVGNPVFTPYNAKGPSGANAYNPHRVTNWYE